MEAIVIPKEVRYIIGQLKARGHAAYCVGGCVRDSLLGRAPDDWDITTSALPAEIKQTFRHTVDTGIRHGTVTVLIYPGELEEESDGRQPEGKPACFEVTTYRIDGLYADGRHPEQVTFTDKLSEDLKRRDFTINAMAYSEETGLVDLFGGLKDLEHGVIRCVGDPDERFDEDALRILRAVRFSAQLGFAIEPATRAAITRHAAFLDLVSKERIYVELNKLLCSAHMEKVQELFDLGLSGHIAAGFQDSLPLGPGTDEVLDPENPDTTLPAVSPELRYQRYALSYRGKPGHTVRGFLNALKSDAATAKHAAFAAPLLLTPLPHEPYALKKLIAKTDPVHFRALLEMKQSISRTEGYQKACGKEDIDALIRLFDGIMDRDEPIYLKDLVVTGKDLMDAGLPSGPRLGKVLNTMLEDVLHDPEHNSILYLFMKHLRPQ